MKFAIEHRQDHIYASVRGRETGEEMREFLVAVHGACGTFKCPRILMSIRASRPVFKPEDYGIATYVNELVTDKCRIGLVGDTPELNAAHEYIEVCARQQGMNVRAFGDESGALRWLRGTPEPAQRYRLSRIVAQGAPDVPGLYTLWNNEQVVFSGRTADGTTIRSSLLSHLEESGATHYSWEVTPP